MLEGLTGATFATSQGRKANFDALKAYENVDFYILGVRPNSSRLSIKFYQKNKFGVFQEKIYRHFYTLSSIATRMLNQKKNHKLGGNHYVKFRIDR